MASFLKTNKSLIINFPGRTKTLDVTSALAQKAIALLKAGASDQEILNAIDITEVINSTGVFRVQDGLVYVGADVLPDSLGNRIIDFQNGGLPIKPLLLFWDNCKLNPDPRAKTDLYKFLEHNGHPITSDGCFIGYRSVRKLDDGTFVDWNSGKFDNSVGKIVRMKREDCDADPYKTCSRGLHVAAMEYAKGFNSYENRVLVEVKVNPKDVVAIPVDYNGQKMRVCEFQVVAVNADIITRPCYDPENLVEVDDDADDEDLDETVDDTQEIETGATVSDGKFDMTSITPMEGWKNQARDKNGRFKSKSKSAKKASKGPKRLPNGRFAPKP